MIITYGLSNLNKYFIDLEDLVLVIYTNEITDELILSLDELLLSSHIKFQISNGDKFIFSVTLPVWKKFSENIITLIISGLLTENQFSYHHLKCMNCLENLFIEEINYPFLGEEEIKNLLDLKHIIIKHS